MSNLEALRTMRAEPLFPTWADYVKVERIDGASEAVRTLIDKLIALGPNPDESAARELADQCVLRLNDLDEDGWICTIEREDLCAVIDKVVELAGFEPDEDWTGEREW